MVSSLFVDALKDPTSSLLDLYDTCNPGDDFPAVVSEYFSNVFQKVDAFHEIPRLCVKIPPEVYPDRSLVCFRAMVQDTSCGQELYLSKRRSGGCGGWGLADSTDIDGDSTDLSLLKECTVVWAVSVPGETKWCSQEMDRPDHGASCTRTHQPPRPHKFPTSGSPHIGVQVKLYDQQDTHLPKTTDVMTFVGILTSEFLHPESEDMIRVPTLHVLYSQKHPLTLIPQIYRDPHLRDVSGVREALIKWIADEALAGDKEAAEWVLLVALGRVQSRTPVIFPPSLTISQFPRPADRSSVPTLFHVLSQILPLSSLLPLSLNRLNRDNFSPESKNEDLHSGIMQVPAGSTFVVTESEVEEGKLEEKGVLNIRTLQEIISSQTISYTFPYSSFSFPTDIAFIVLSEGRKSALLQTSVVLPLRAAEPSKNLYKANDEINLPTDEHLVEFRRLVGGAKTGSNVQVDRWTSERIQADFVQERQEDRSIGAEDLMLRITLARLLALSMHLDEVNSDIWERAKTLDGKRRARLRIAASSVSS